MSFCSDSLSRVDTITDDSDLEAGYIKIPPPAANTTNEASPANSIITINELKTDNGSNATGKAEETGIQAKIGGICMLLIMLTIPVMIWSFTAPHMLMIDGALGFWHLAICGLDSFFLMICIGGIIWSIAAYFITLTLHTISDKLREKWKQAGECLFIVALFGGAIGLVVVGARLQYSFHYFQ